MPRLQRAFPTHNRARTVDRNPQETRHSLWRFGLALVLAFSVFFPSSRVGAADNTPPATPVVTDGGEFTSSRTELGIQWTSLDPESPNLICTVEVRVDSRTGSRVYWNQLACATFNGLLIQGLSLADGRTYFVGIAARNSAGLWSPTGWSNGIRVDATPPSMPTVTDDGVIVPAGTSSLHARWTAASDLQSDIAGYEYQIRSGSASGAAIVPWTSITTLEVTRTGLTLTAGTAYYFAVRAKNRAGGYSSVAVSDGITVQAVTGVRLPSVVSISGRQLYVRKRNADGTLATPQPYVIRAVNWSPASRTTATSSSDVNNVIVRRPEFGTWYLRDIPLLKAMNVNTVRLFMDPGLPGDPNVIVPGLTVLDELYRNGIMAIMTVDNSNNTVERIRPVIEHYRNHPAILLWSLGSEWNINRFWKPAQFPTVESAAVAIESAAKLVKSLDAQHPVVSSFGNIETWPSDVQRFVNSVCPTVDIWSFNEYTGPGLSRLFDQWRFISGKPMFLGEFGIDAWNSLTNREDQPTQAQWVGRLWDDIARNLSADNAANIALGGAVFSFSDEWWKSGGWNAQDFGGWAPLAFPDGFASEDWWGIVTIDRTPRAVYETLRTKFAAGYVPPAATQTVLYRADSVSPVLARFWENGALMYDGQGATMNGARGFNIAAIDNTTGALHSPIQRFDTWTSRDTGVNMNALIAWLDSLPNGTLLLIAVADEAGLNDWTNTCVRLPYTWVTQLIQRLEALGSRQIRNYCYSDQWSMIAIKGQGVALSEAIAHATTGTSATAQATVSR